MMRRSHSSVRACGDGTVDRQTAAMTLGFDPTCESRDEPLTGMDLGVLLGLAKPPPGYVVVEQPPNPDTGAARMPRVMKIED